MDVRPGYKRTDAGVIPEDWRTATLLDVAECLDNLRVPLNETQRQKMQGDVPYCGANGVLDFVNDFVIDDDIILVAEDGGYFDEFASRPIAYRMRGRCWVNNHAHILKAKPGRDQGFLFYSLVHKNVLPFLASGTRAKLNKSEMERIVVSAPGTEAEQRAIAEALSDVDALLAGLDRLIAKKRDLKQAAMQQLLTGQTRLPGFDGKWKMKRLGDVLAICHGRNQRNVETPHGLYPILASGGQIGAASRPLYDKPSVLIGRKGTINKPQFMDTPFWTVDTLFYSEMKNSNSARFFFYMFCMIDWMKFNEASGVPSLNARTIEHIEIDCPEPREQIAIAQTLTDMDAELAALEARRDKTRALKQAMMQELLTGNTRLV